MYILYTIPGLYNWCLVYISMDQTWSRLSVASWLRESRWLFCSAVTHAACQSQSDCRRIGNNNGDILRCRMSALTDTGILKFCFKYFVVNVNTKIIFLHFLCGNFGSYHWKSKIKIDVDKLLLFGLYGYFGSQWLCYMTWPYVCMYFPS